MPPTGAAQAPANVIEAAKNMRQNLDAFEKAILNTKADVNTQPLLEGEDRGEVMANLTLAYRYVEDARMRLGKVIQAASGGVSIYDAAPAN